MSKMTLDELLQQLMKIKEVYPDGGKMPIIIDDADTNWYLQVYKEDVKVINNKLVFSANYSNRE